ncbi:MAG: ThuA domain-containing protein [Verrucomicrobia bacterium]|nr:ThuA domain-containing protein [Verrucomicrobiota bacterium]
MSKIIKSLLSLLLLLGALNVHGTDEGPVRVLFLGHDAEHHPSNAYFPMISKALGRDAIYFDYMTSVEEALGDADYLGKFDAVLLYANHAEITSNQWKNLLNFVETGGGFLPIHCASWCFSNEPGFDQLVGGRFAHHRTGVFQPKTVLPDHEAIKDVPALEAWDETYVHVNHNLKDRVVLQVREVAGPDDNIKEPEPWTWIRTQGEGRVFYTASGHDHRVWGRDEFHQLIKKGVLWSIGDERRQSYEAFLNERVPLAYEKRDNIPNYERRPEPLPYQLPLSPEESLQYTQVPVGFRLELFASEPDIVNPICMAWDHRGRLWVAEAVDYPNELTNDRTGRDSIKILEDTNGDGRCDKVTVFADGLNVPTSIVFANGGVIVAQAPDFLFFQDTNGDDKADVREVLNTGWGVADTHAGPSSFRYGLDNRVWGTVGYSGYSERRGDSDVRFGNGVFNMKADGSDVTFMHQFNNNTWGLGFNSAGDVFGSTANNNPAFFGGFPATGYQGSPSISALMIADHPEFQPITPNIRQVDAFGRYTAGAGYALATSDRFPESWRDSMAFISGPTGNLLGMYQNVPHGSGYKAINRYSLIASADEWFSPVSAEVGPDGHLWVADWYNFIIQHNPTPSPQRGGYEARTGKGNAHVNPNRDRQHGRIYRLIYKPTESQPTIISLANSSNEALVEVFDDSNMFWRMTAQRMLIERKTTDVVQLLRRKVVDAGRSAVHAFWTLDGLGQLDREIHQAALLSKNPVLRRNAIKALGTSEEDIQLFFDTAVVAAGDLQVRREAFVKMAHFPKHASLEIAIPQLFRDEVNRKDDWLSLALKAASRNQGVAAYSTSLGENILPNASFEETRGDRPAAWRPATYNDRGGTTFSYEDDPAYVRTGKRSIKITSTQGADVGWSANVSVKPNTDYKMSGWVKTEGVRGARGGLMNVHTIGEGVTSPVSGDSDWKKVEVTFNTGGQDSILINCLFGGWGTSRGTAWYDDVSLQEVVIEIANEEAANLEGDVERGRKIFNEHPVASCVRCHQVNAQGGFVGPYLDDIARRKDAAYIRESILDPQAAIAEGFPAEVSPMPPFGVLLPPQDIEDLMAYLMTLKNDPPEGTVKEIQQEISFE